MTGHQNDMLKAHRSSFQHSFIVTAQQQPQLQQQNNH